MRWISGIAAFLSFILSVSSLSFYVQPGSKRCVKEEVHKSQMVVGQYTVSGDFPGVSIKVTDTRGHILFTKDDATKGKFAFTEDEYDVVDVCFSSKSPDGSKSGPGREVKLSLKHGTEAKDYKQLAKVEKLKPLELELRRLEDLAQEIVGDFQYMREREREMRDTNESTNTRVLWFSFFSIGCLFALATWQVIYLRNYFKAKKLIE